MPGRVDAARSFGVAWPPAHEVGPPALTDACDLRPRGVE